jgi:hypothetical protein
MAYGFLSRHASALRRATIAICGTGAATFCWLDWRLDHPPDFQVIDVAARARAIAAAASPQESSLTDVYYFAPGGSAHLHVFGKGFVCHLHLHEHTEEATITVWGSPRVTQLFGAGGTVETKAARYPEGTLIVSPPDCAHEWVNLSESEGHASLVFTLGAPFPGNLFVHPDDARILGSSPPQVFDAKGDLERFAQGPDRVSETRAPITLGAAAEVLVKDEYVVAPKERTVTFVYAVAGNGRLQGLAGTPPAIALSPEILVIAHSSPALKVVADPAAPLALFVIRIPKKDS